MWKRFIPLLCLFCAFGATARPASGGSVLVTDVAMERQSDTVSVSMILDVSSLDVKKARSVAFTPVMKAPGHTKELPSVEVMGGKMYVYYLRNKNTGTTKIYRRNTGAEQHIPYKVSFPYESWMDNALLYLTDSRRKCCSKVVSEETMLIKAAQKREFIPVHAYLTPERSPESGAKLRSVSGVSYIDFPSARWEIRENYKDNATELYKIYRSIEQLRSSEDYSVTSIHLTGYASPESSWASNARLAKKRSEALKYYLCSQLSLSPEMVSVSYVAEDWDGLREYVRSSSLSRKEDILLLIDSDFFPDTKEAILRKEFPAQFRTLMNDCFPLLRRTKYEIAYQVKTYKTFEQLESVFMRKPSDLSLQEMYALAASYPEGSGKYNHVFETAVILYPEDHASNLNVAVASMISGNFAKAAEFLPKAGNSPEALNARGILANYSGDRDKAYRLFSEAAAHGLSAAVKNAQSITK